MAQDIPRKEMVNVLAALTCQATDLTVRVLNFVTLRKVVLWASTSAKSVPLWQKERRA